MSEVTRAEKPRADWRIGIAVTQKMRTHGRYRQLGVIRRIHRETDDTREMLDVELYEDGGITRLAEPSSDWMTA